MLMIMTASTCPFRFSLAARLLSVLTCLLGVCLLSGCGDSPIELTPDHVAKDFDPILTKYAREAVVLVKIIRAHEASLSQLPGSAGNRDWTYSVNGASFRLVRKLGRQPTLVYQSADNTWFFNPGDGSPPTRIQLDVDLPGAKQ